MPASDTAVAEAVADVEVQCNSCNKWFSHDAALRGHKRWCFSADWSGAKGEKRKGNGDVQPTAKRADSLDIHVDGEATLTVAAVISKQDYINDRTRLVNGKRVLEAVGTLVPNTKGEIVKYKFKDLKYDVQRGLLLVDGEERSGREGEGSVVKPVKPRRKPPPVRARPPSGFYGVSAGTKRWLAKIRYDRKDHFLGTFDTKQEAALAYDREARQCGKAKPLNYESIAAAEEAATQAQAEHTLANPPQLKPRSSSGFYGVRAEGNRWSAKISYDSKQHYLGSFDTKQEAALAYDREARQCGKDKPLNYESIEAAEEAAVQAQAERIVVYDANDQPSRKRSRMGGKVRARPPSGFYGVSAGNKGMRWKVQIAYGGKKHYLGTFDTKQEAALAYDREARQCGEDKPLNYESIAAAEEAAAHAQAGHALVMCAAPKPPKPRTPSGFHGVSAASKGGRWKAEIRYDSKQHYLGTFGTKQEAALAYDRKARQCGGNKPLNYESIAAAEEEAAAHAQGPPQRQRRHRPASGFYGVSAAIKGGRWKSEIGYDSKKHYLGTFDTKQEAALAYDKKARQCGGNKPLNYESVTPAAGVSMQLLNYVQQQRNTTEQ
jgi:hypothetical protein